MTDLSIENDKICDIVEYSLFLSSIHFINKQANKQKKPNKNIFSHFTLTFLKQNKKEEDILTALELVPLPIVVKLALPRILIQPKTMV